MKMEGIRGKILAVTIVVCSLWIGTFSFTLDAVASEVPMYELTVTVVSGHGTVEPNSGSYSAGTVVSLTATPEAAYYVVRQWTGTDDDTSCALTNTVTMDSDKTVTVEFAQPHVFVVPGGYTTIQGAIDAAACGDVVVLSPGGVYFEDINFNGKNIRVTSTNPDDPMCVASTIIQGTGAGPVVTFSGGESRSCVLDGLTITGGNTTGDGGGICGNGTEAMIANCVITNNHADGYGGGLSNCNGTIERCTITGNTAGSFGGGVYLAGGGAPQVRQCLITGNTAGEKGGGLLFAHTPAVIENCILSDNVAKGVNGSGGAISFYGGEVAHLVKNCLLTGNSAEAEGGAISSRFFGIPEIMNCTFSGNSAGSFGGAIFCDWSSDPTITDSIFQNCNNHAIYEEEVGNAIVTYSLFHNNIDGDYGIYDSNTGLTTTTAGVDLDVTNIEGDPLFVTGLFGNYYLNQNASPAIDNGSDTAVNLGLDAFTTDPNGVTDTGQVDIGYHYSDWLFAPRYKLTIILVGDHGTVEPDSGSYFAGTVVTLTATPEAGYYVVRQWTGTDDDTSCALTNTVTMDSDKTVTVEFRPPTMIQVSGDPNALRDAVNAAGNGDTLIVAAGTYNGGINFNGKNIKVLSTNPEDPNIVALTVIHGTGAGPVVTFSGGESRSCVLDGLTITGGSTAGDGGGICGNGTEATIANCVITNNHADGYGGGVSGCNGTIERCTITGNTAGVVGGGIYVVDCNVSVEDCDINYNAAAYGGGLYCWDSPGATITRCTISDNDANGSGGGIFVFESPIPIEDCRISRNNAINSGGGIYFGGSDQDPFNNTLLHNCLVTLNRAGRDGGGISVNWFAEPVISNCTIADNQVTGAAGVGYGGGLSSSYDSNVEVINSIIWGNLAEQGFQVAVSSGSEFEPRPSTLTISYSDVEGGPGGAYVELGCMLDWGIGTIDSDPQLVDPNGGDWHLGAGSPCIDAGDNSAVPPSVLTDLDGNPRIINGTVDMGAYEVTLEVTMYDLTVTVVSEHGTVEPNSGSYFAGTVVTLTATPEPDYMLRQWTGTDDDTSCALSNTVTMDSDKTVTVEFGMRHLFKVPLEYATIQEAIDAAGCGDMVILSTGVHYGDINFNGKNIIVSSMNPDDPMCVEYTIIQGSGAGPVVTFSGSESQSCVLDGLTITGGNTTGDGGGICGNGTDATIANCVITNNHADGAGGGLSNCNGTIERCTITGNTADYGGGGIYVVDCNVTVKDCDINYNAAADGGGLYCLDSPGATITRCTISDNDANGSGARGGGIFVFSSPILIEDCRISRNNTINSGGGVYLAGDAVPQVRQCLITENTAGEDGGGISCGWQVEPIISNCTIAENAVANGYGGGLYCSYESNVEVINSIIWGNFAQQGFQVAVNSGDLPYPLPSMLALSYSDVEGGPGGAYVGAGCTLDWGIGTIDSDPQLVDPNGGDWHLGAGSPCIDAGDNTAVPPSVLTDLDGNPRIINGIVDMGAYESTYEPTTVYHVDTVNGDNTNDGLTRGTAFATIQKGIDTALNSDTVLVADGTYLGDGNRDIDFKGKAITVRSENGPQTCIIDCQTYDYPYHRGFYFHNAESEYAVLEGFTILNGMNGSGGGILCTDGASPTIRNNIIEGNRTPFDADGGGGIACKRGASPVIVGNVIRNNYCEPGSGGGGIHCYKAGSPLICYNVITGNHANGGGGIEIAYGTNAVTIIGNLIVANDAKQAGAIRSWATNCDLTISNNTIVENVAEYTSGGIYIEDTINAAVTNCIIWGNRDRNGTIESSQITGSSTNYSCIQGWTGSLGGIGNIGDNPLFVDADGIDNIIGTEDDNLRLLAGSPCVDAGDNSAVPPSVLTDLDGNPRIANYIADMGAYEFQGPFKRYYHVDGVNGDNTNDGLTRETAFATIQRGINVAEDYETVLVWPGVYNEEIGFWGDAITVKSAADAAVVETDYGYAFSFYSAEGPGTVLSNFIIRDSQYGIYLVNGSSPTLSNLTIVNNDFGISAFNGSDPDISNCIFWDNYYGDLFRDPVPLQAKYSCIEEGGEGEGNISIEPLFVDANSGDYHLLSERGRYWPAHDVWVLDKVTSPCVDGGDPAVDQSGERMPNGGRINMGAYGNTAYASMSEMRWLDGDINHDNIVNMIDLALLANNWLETLPWAINEPPEVTITNPEDGSTVPYNGIYPVPVEADASDIDGSVEKVEFFANGDKIGQDNDGSDGWAIGWHPESDGSFNLTAKATDNDAATATSPIVQVQVGYVW